MAQDQRAGVSGGAWVQEVGVRDDPEAETIPKASE